MSRYMVADIKYIPETFRNFEIERAARYSTVEEYIDDAGWQDWMEDFCEDEECTEAELRVIEETQRLIWAEAHEKKTERINLRISPALKLKAERKAQEEARSLNSYIEWLIMTDK